MSPAVVVGVSSATTGDAAAAAEDTLLGFVAVALGDDFGVACSVVHGGAVNALLSAARGAQLLVIGEPWPGRLTSVKASLVAPQLVHKTGCPVVVMPTSAVPTSLPPES